MAMELLELNNKDILCMYVSFDIFLVVFLSHLTLFSYFLNLNGAGQRGGWHEVKLP